MFADPVRGSADLVLPGTSYLERDGTIVNLEGRLQRLRRAVIPPAPDELAWIAKLAERFGVVVARTRAASSTRLRARATAAVARGERRARVNAARRRRRRSSPAEGRRRRSSSSRYRPLFLRAGRRARARAPVPAAASRVIELSADDAQARGIAHRRRGRRPLERHLRRAPRAGHKQLVRGTVRAAEEHVRTLEGAVEVSQAPPDQLRRR